MITGKWNVEFEVRGKGPLLVLINGLGFGSWAWFKQTSELSRHFRVVTFDTQGKPDLKDGVADIAAVVAALLHRLGVRKSHLLGTSLGGFVAQELALKRPDLVDRLVLICTSYGGKNQDVMSPGTLAAMFGLGAVNRNLAARRGLEVATSEAYRVEYPEEFERIVSWRLENSPSLSSYLRQALAGVRFDFSREARNISAATMVIHGSDDRIVPVANAAALAAAIPSAKLRVLDRAGHLVFIERAKEVNEEVISFLRSHKPFEERSPQ
ncbi:MAG: alpha/beta fold hydrolase [Rubrobacteraceae bacterium]